MSSEDMYLWIDGFWCFRDEFNPGFQRHDDYRVVPHQSEEWHVLEKRGLVANIKASL